MSCPRFGKGWLFFALMLPISLAAQPVPPPLAVPPTSNPTILHGYARLEGFTLKEPGTDKPLTQRHIEVITVVGDVDPPFSEGDDRVQMVNPEYNYPRFKELMNANPGMVTATMTVFVEEPSATDERVQLWERVLVRVFDSEDKATAKHYCDTTIWKAQPGFNDLTSAQIQFGEWKTIKRHNGK